MIISKSTKTSTPGTRSTASDDDYWQVISRAGAAACLVSVGCYVDCFEQFADPTRVVVVGASALGSIFSNCQSDADDPDTISRCLPIEWAPRAPIRTTDQRRRTARQTSEPTTNGRRLQCMCEQDAQLRPANRISQPEVRARDLIIGAAICLSATAAAAAAANLRMRPTDRQSKVCGQIIANYSS